MKEELMRRISQALDTEGLGSDAELQKELRVDADASKYAKDLTRINMWLATWPLPEPDEAAFEAIASRIEQRMDEGLPAVADVAAPPMFEDDDALRDATVGLLESGEYRLGEIAGGLLVEPSSGSMPASPIARVLLEKKASRGVVEESSGESSGEPLSAADLELRLSLDPKPRKKKKGPVPPAPPPEALAPGKVGSTRPPPIAAPVTLPLEAHEAPAPAKAARAIPELRIAGAADAPKAKRGERSSPSHDRRSTGGARVAAVAEVQPARNQRPAGSWWAFAAAACVGLGVFGAATLFEGGGRAPAEPASSSASVATVASILPSASVGAPSPAPLALVPPAAPPAVAAVEAAAPDPAPLAHEQRQDLLAAADRVAEPSRAAARPTTALPESPRGMGGSLYDGADGLAPRSRRSAPTTATTRDPEVAGPRPAPEPEPAPTVAPEPVRPSTTTPVPTVPSTPAPTPPADDLPEVPDRATIQAVLEGVQASVLACGGGEHGTADVDIVIAGSGRVTTATVNGPFAGTPTGSCIARAVRGARFPAFAQTRFAVTYPFHL